MQIDPVVVVFPLTIAIVGAVVRGFWGSFERKPKAPPALPVTLKPLVWTTVFLASLSLALVAAGIASGFAIRDHTAVFVGFWIAFATFFGVGAVLNAKPRLHIDSDGFTYQGIVRTIRVSRDDVLSYRKGDRSGLLSVEIRHRTDPLKITADFQNMGVFHACLQAWIDQSHKKRVYRYP